MSQSMDLDFTGVTTSNLIPEGTHVVRISAADFSKAQTGSDQLEVEFENGDGATRKGWFSLVPQALWKVKGFLEAIGISADGRIKLNTKNLIGKYCKIVVEPDKNDSTRFIITKYLKAESNNTVAPQMYAPAAPLTYDPAMMAPAGPAAPVQPIAQPAPVAQQPTTPAPAPAMHLPWETAQQPAQPVQQPMQQPAAQQPASMPTPPWLVK